MSRAICAAARKASIASYEPPARMRATPSSTCVSPATRASSIPSSSAAAKRTAASSKPTSSAPRGRPAASTRSRAGARPPAQPQRTGRQAAARPRPSPTGCVCSQRLGDAKVELGAPQSGHPVVQRAAHQLVRELVGQPRRGDLLDHPVRDRLLESGGTLLVVQPGLRDLIEAELGPGDGGQLEQLRGGERSAGQAAG